MNQTEKMIIKFLKNTFIFLPLIYFAGALLDSCDVFLRDFIYGLPFLLVGIYFLIKENVGLLLLSSAYLFHVVFDLLYFFFIEDSYMIPFYEIICIFYDFFAGLYLLKKRSLSWWFYKPPCWLYSTVTEYVNLDFHSPLFLFINFFIEREIIAIKKNTVPTSWRPSMPNKLSNKYIAIARIIKTQNSYFFKNLIIFWNYSTVTECFGTVHYSSL